MRVLLVNPSTGYFTRALFNPLGLMAIGSYLRSIGHEVRLLDRCIDNTRFRTVLDEFKPQLIGVSLMSSRTLKDAIKISKIAKEYQLYVTWGGAMASMQEDIILGSDYVDSVIFSEGEYTFKELIEALEGKRDFSSVKSLYYKENGKIIKNEPRPFADLADFPMFDFSLINVEDYLQQYLGCKKMMYLYSSKGCPYHCTFCSNTVFHRSCHRKKPNEIVIKEIKYLIENYGLDGIYFSDELWVIKRSDMIDFCRRVKEENLHFHWGMEMRIGIFSEEDYQMMYDAGCRWVLYGIESGSPQRLKAVKKQIDYEQILPTFKCLKKIGITSVASFIIGFPDETEEELKETCALMQQINANLTPVFHFTPLPGTQLYNEVVAKGVFKAPTTMKDLTREIATETLAKNFSAVASTDLRVIRSYFHWKSFTKKDSLESNRDFTFALQTILNGLNSISKKGILMFFHDGFKALHEFLYVFWYSHAYPRIKKKYGLK